MAKLLGSFFVLIYFVGSLACGVVGTSACCPSSKKSLPPCHASSEKESQQPKAGSGLCCCSFSANLPKIVEFAQEKESSFFSLTYLFNISNLKIYFSNLILNLSPPLIYSNYPFYKKVFSSLAPPLAY